MTKIFTAEEFVEAATFDGDVYWIEATGEDITVNIPRGSPERSYGMRGAEVGSLMVCGLGQGSAFRDGSGKGTVYRHGSGDGDAFRSGSGFGGAYRTGDGDGGAYRYGDGNGSAERSDSGAGRAFRGGSGRGSASRSGEGKGAAVRAGSGPGNANRLGSGYGNAIRLGSGEGNAARLDGVGMEHDRNGKRYRITSGEIPYTCNFGDGWLRIGCELHPLKEWATDAEEIDEGHGGGIAHLTRDLALSLMTSKQRTSDFITDGEVDKT